MRRRVLAETAINTNVTVGASDSTSKGASHFQRFNLQFLSLVALQPTQATESLTKRVSVETCFGLGITIMHRHNVSSRSIHLLPQLPLAFSLFLCLSYNLFFRFLILSACFFRPDANVHINGVGYQASPLSTFFFVTHLSLGRPHILFSSTQRTARVLLHTL